MHLCHKPSVKKIINRIDNFEHWPESIKTTIQWFKFIDIMEYTGNDMISDIPLTTSLLKMFSMFRGISLIMAFPVYSIISRNGNHLIVVFIDSGQCSKLSI